MSELPRPLARWKQELSEFPEEIGLLLGRFVARLSPAFDALARHDTPDHGEIDGFDGLSRRGTPERLLPTEWALARLAPLEFLRRAAQMEQQYYKLAHRVPAAPRGSVVLLEAGPDQLGAPRLAQLAVLILLFERARRARGTVAWQLVHRLGESMLTTFDRQSVHSFLRGRTALPTGSSALGEWRRSIAEWFGDGELWLLGSPAFLSEAPAKARSIAISERVDRKRGVLDVEFRSRSRAPRRVELELPEPGTAARVLRDPFEEPAQAPGIRPPRPDANLLFSPTGSRLFYRDAEGTLVELFVPENPRQPIGPGRRHAAPHGTLVTAVGIYGRNLAWLGTARGVAVLTSVRPLRRDVPIEVRASAPIADGAPELWPLVAFTSPLSAILVAADRSLWRVFFEERWDSVESELVAEGVLALAPLRRQGALAVVEHYGGGRRGPRRGPVLLELFPSSERVVNVPVPRGSPVFLRTAMRSGAETWCVAAPFERTVPIVCHRPARGSEPTGTRTEIMSVPEGARVVGIDISGNKADDLGLYLLDDRSSVSVVGRGRSRVIAQSRSPIVDIAIASAAGRIAYTTEAGELALVERSGTTLWKGSFRG